MQDAIFAFMQQFGYLAVSALIFLENVFPPIPSELILPLAGFFSNTGALWLPLAILAATAGSLAGAYVLYAVGTGLDERRMEKILSLRPARLLGFEKGDVQAAFGWFETKGAKTVFICRCVPVVRSLISIPAGMSHMKILKFSAMTFAGSLIWNAILCTVGYLAGDAWQNAASGAASLIDHVTYIVLISIAVAALFWFMKRVLPKIKSQDRGGTGPVAE